jgi:hypothetical protein
LHPLSLSEHCGQGPIFIAQRSAAQRARHAMVAETAMTILSFASAALAVVAGAVVLVEAVTRCQPTPW